MWFFLWINYMTLVLIVLCRILFPIPLSNIKPSWIMFSLNIILKEWYQVLWWIYISKLSILHCLQKYSAKPVLQKSCSNGFRKTHKLKAYSDDSCFSNFFCCRLTTLVKRNSCTSVSYQFWHISEKLFRKISLSDFTFLIILKLIFAS